LISKSGFNTPQLAVADFERLKLLVAESEKFRGEYSVACCGDILRSRRVINLYY